jgi:hypothetical protein
VGRLNRFPGGQQQRWQEQGAHRQDLMSRKPGSLIWVVLTEADYLRAIDAHREGLTVEATGQLTISSRRLELKAGTFEVFRP